MTLFTGFKVNVLPGIRKDVVAVDFGTCLVKIRLDPYLATNKVYKQSISCRPKSNVNT